MELSRARAENEFGIKIHSTTYSTNNVRVWLDFPQKDKLADFLHVNLEIKVADKTLVSAALRPMEQPPDKISVAFSTDPVYLASSRLTIVVRASERTTIGYQLKIKDFVNPQPPK